MTKRLEEAVKRISELPDEDQEFYASLLLGELEHVATPQWHLDLLKERQDEMSRNPDDVVPWEDVLKEMKERTQR